MFSYSGRYLKNPSANLLNCCAISKMASSLNGSLSLRFVWLFNPAISRFESFDQQFSPSTSSFPNYSSVLWAQDKRSVRSMIFKVFWIACHFLIDNYMMVRINWVPSILQITKCVGLPVHSCIEKFWPAAGHLATALWICVTRTNFRLFL